MKRIAVAIVILVGTLAAAGCTPGRYAQYDRRHQEVSDTLSTMKKADVITLSKAGVSDSLIITMLDVSGSWFNLRTQDVLDLKNAGVSDKVINAMVGSKAPSAEGGSYDERGYAAYYSPYYYPPYYWNAGWYAGWYSGWPYYGLYPSWYYGYNYYRPIVVHRYSYPHRTYWGGGGGGGRSYGGRGGGGHRR